jgi:hypothetical protein
LHLFQLEALRAIYDTGSPIDLDREGNEGLTIDTVS